MDIVSDSNWDQIQNVLSTELLFYTQWSNITFYPILQKEIELLILFGLLGNFQIIG